VTVHEKPVGATVEWYTPPELFRGLGEFYLDPACGDIMQCHVPAVQHWFRDGATMRWTGRVWLNPPYGPAGVPFIDRMIEHGNGLLLLPARTETQVFQRAARAADLICFLRDRLHFIREDGFQARSSFGSVLMAFGFDNVGRLGLADLGFMTFPVQPFRAVPDGFESSTDFGGPVDWSNARIGAHTP
jgi:hypothetical protein